MKTFQQLLKDDQERFTQQLSGTLQVSEAEKICRDEYNRLLSIYNEQDLSEDIKRNALRMIDTAGSSVSLMDHIGQTKIYSRKEYTTKDQTVKEKRSIWFWIFLLCAFVVTGFGTVTLYPYDEALMKDTDVLKALAAAGIAMVLFFISGVLSHRKKADDKPEFYAEYLIDTQKIYHTMLGVMTGIDHVLEEIQREEILKDKQKLLNHEDILEQSETDLLCHLLESAYAQKDTDFARETISEISFYLHKHGIETQDYTEEHAEWFDKMPGNTGTIRPALIIQGTLYRKGICSGGTR